MATNRFSFDSFGVNRDDPSKDIIGNIIEAVEGWVMCEVTHDEAVQVLGEIEMNEYEKELG